MLLIALAPCLAGHVSAQQRRDDLRSAIRGRVVDETGTRAIRGVEVRLAGTDLSAVTDDDGEFRLSPVRPGAHVVVSQHLGYADRTDSLDVPRAALLVVTMTLAAEAIELDPIVVEVRSPVLDRHGFYDRRAQGFGGTFIDRAKIEKKNPETVSALFRNIPGLRVVYGGIRGARVFFNQRVNFRDTTPGCEPMLWIDGVRSTMGSYDMMRVEEVAGIEVYAGGGAPGKFNDLCGTVVIWTRVPLNR